MAVPDYETLMTPLLKILADGREHRLRDLTARLADEFQLTEEDRQELLPSGQQTLISNRVGWAKAYLKKAGLVDSPARGCFRLSEEGKRVLQDPAVKVDNKFLARYPAYLEFKSQKKRPEAVTATDTAAEADDQTPDEAIESAYRDLRSALADDLIDQVMACSPAFFERLVVELLVAMGYGGSLADAGKAIGRTGDEGIDGIIKEDKLGLDVVCIQAKRWSNTVGRPHVQAFAGSMEGYRAKKGVMLTTSSFSQEALDYVQRIERRIVLIDGQRLAELMIDHNIGTTTTRSYKIKKVDSDYFTDDGRS